MTRKLLIAIPSFDTMRVEFVRSLMGLTEKLHAEGVWFEVKILDGTLVHIARDRLAVSVCLSDIPVAVQHTDIRIFDQLTVYPVSLFDRF